MSNIARLGTAIVSFLGLGALTYYFNRQALEMGQELWNEVKDSVEDIKQNGPDFSGAGDIFRLPEQEREHENN